jgi:hypothetical protein
MIMDRVLFINHDKEKCGIHQYGVDVAESLVKSNKIDLTYAELHNESGLNLRIEIEKPDLIIYNYYPASTPWITRNVTQRHNIPQLGIFHEVTQEATDVLTNYLFDFWLCPDPTLITNNPIALKTKRLIPTYENKFLEPDILTIGSFGFGFWDKGFERIVSTVQEELDVANIRFNMPFNDVVNTCERIEPKVDPAVTARNAMKRINKKGINVTITHEFFTKAGMLDFLGKNNLNMFLYDVEKRLGISSCVEQALAVQRPIALNRCGMFRHMFSASPSIFVEDLPIWEIAVNGTKPLEPFCEIWSEYSFRKDYERILLAVLDGETKMLPRLPEGTPEPINPNASPKKKFPKLRKTIRKIHITSLDSFCQSHFIKYINLVKMDVEGYEPKVIKGMDRLLKEKMVKWMLVELLDTALVPAGSSAKELDETIKSYGFVQVKERYYDETLRNVLYKLEGI